MQLSRPRRVPRLRQDAKPLWRRLVARKTEGQEWSTARRCETRHRLRGSRSFRFEALFGSVSIRQLGDEGGGIGRDWERNEGLKSKPLSPGKGRGAKENRRRAPRATCYCRLFSVFRSFSQSNGLFRERLSRKLSPGLSLTQNARTRPHIRQCMGHWLTGYL